MDYQDIFERAFWTFIQGFTGLLIASGAGLLDGVAVWEGAAAAGLGGVVAFLHRVATERLEVRKVRQRARGDAD